MDENSHIKIEQFAEIVRRFCVWAESPFSNVKTEMPMARSMLAELHSAVFLPDVEPEDVELEDVTSDEWKKVLDRFSNLPVNGYHLVFDPTEVQDGETVYAQLADDLADIYRDLKYGLKLFDAGYLSDAVWEWKFHFENHWGWHLLGAQRLIHFWFMKHGDDL